MYEHLTFYTYEGLLIVVGPANAVDAAMPILPACRATLLRFAHPLPSARSLSEAVRPHLRRAAREHGVAVSWVVTERPPRSPTANKKLPNTAVKRFKR